MKFDLTARRESPGAINGGGIPFARQSKLYVFILFNLISFQLYSQMTVTGFVEDVNGKGIAGVTVKVKNASAGSSTDSIGRFSINVANGNDILIFSSTGYRTREEAIGGRANISMVLERELTNLDEVLVVGYGAQSRATVTTAISKVDNKALQNVPFANPASALQGTVSGVRVQTTSGQPGAAPRVIVRGGTSINNPNGAAPLYIIDGVIRGNMNDIAAEDIESIQVLKDAASTSIYGARGSNGVVIISTKSGRSGSPRITYNYDLTRSALARGYDFASARDFIYFQRLGIAASAEKKPNQLSMLTGLGAAGTGNDLTNNTAYTTQYLTPDNEYKLNEGWESMPDPIDPTKTIIFKSTDFQDVLFQTGWSHNHNLAVSGGSQNATFNASVGYLSNEGIAITTNYKRLSLNLNGDLKLRDNLKVFSRLMYSNRTDNGVNTRSGFVFARSVAAPPTTKYRFEDGSLAPGANYSIGNAVYHLNSRVAENVLDNLTMVVGAHWELLNGLSFDPQVSIFSTVNDSRLFQKAGLIFGPTGYSAARDATAGHTKQFQKQADAVFSYNRTFGDLHNLEAKAGFSYFGLQNTALNAAGRNAATDLIPTLNASAQPVSVSSTENNQVIAGYFSRINYSFDQRYLLSLTARYDGASNLGSSNKWGFFPGVSVGWNLHKENFWQDVSKAVSQFKLRGSYGVNGNISGLGFYQAQGQYSTGNQYAGVAAVQNTGLTNQELKWEQSNTFDIGADIGLLGNRISILFDYYRRETKNLLTTLSLPPSTGFGSVVTNLGTLENKGIELELGAKLLPASASVQWDVSFNVSKVKNKILKLPPNGTLNNRIGGYYVWDSKIGDYAWLGGLQEGGSVGDLFAYKQLSIYATDQEAAQAPQDLIIPGNNKTKKGGDVNWLDADNNGVIDEKDRVFVGNIYPKWTGGFSSTVGFGGFSLYLRMDFITGHTIQNQTRESFIGQYQGENGLSNEVLQSWQKQGDITDVPRYYWADQQAQNNLFRGNSRYFERGDFLAVRELTLSYSLPGKMLQKFKISNVRFNVTGNNLYYFTGYQGLNPEDGGLDSPEGGDFGRYPIPRNIIFGASISF
ncbi:MAG: TonB-dependent receptor [Chitinophagaceae bacterium]|nr:TonB-dependent receptor [Chitinophagaceae bacterium]